MGSQILVNGHPNNSSIVHNDISRAWIVQKFGGTSVGKFADQIAENVIRYVQTLETFNNMKRLKLKTLRSSLRGNRVAVVCSARSGITKLEGTTNRLLRAAREAVNADQQAYQKIVSSVEEDHVESAKSYIHDEKTVQNLLTEIEQECLELRLDLAAAQRIGESPGFTDRVISRGENLSSRFMQALLKDRGVDSKFVDLSGIIKFKVPHGLDQEFYQRLAGALAREVEACGNQVPVMTGYFGPVPGGLLNKIGRGYTDLCAALVAVGLCARELQIWKEVEGVFTAVRLKISLPTHAFWTDCSSAQDPRKVPTATLLSKISPAEAAELAYVEAPGLGLIQISD
ncbi:MAG: hypothetical protein Q9191_003221 [Dirinaria sp. TL-2023a]